MKKYLLLLSLFISALSYSQNTHNVPTGIPSPSSAGSNKHHYSRVLNVVDFGAKGDGKIIFDGATHSNTSLTSPSNPFTTGDVGKAIRIPRAGSGGGALVTTITAFVNAGSVTLNNAASATTSADTCVYGTDNTTAFQLAINAACNVPTGSTRNGVNAGAKIIVPVGWFIVAGPLITSYGGDNPNSQLTWPLATLLDTSFNTRANIEISGEFPPEFTPTSWAVDSTVAHTGSVIETLIDGSGNIPAIFGGKANDAGNFFINFNFLTFRNLTFLVPKNDESGGPSMGCINSYYMASTVLDHCVFSIEGATVTSAFPNNEAAAAVLNKYGSETSSKVDNCLFAGFRYGLVVSDGARVGKSIFEQCLYGFVPSKASVMQVGSFLDFHYCVNDVWVPNRTILGAIASGQSVFQINNLNDETNGGTTTHWYKSTYTVSDSANNGFANIMYNMTFSGARTNSKFVQTLGTNIYCFPIGSNFLSMDQTFNVLGVGFTPANSTYEIQTALNNSDGSTHIPGISIYNLNAVQGNGSSTFNFAPLVSVAGNNSVTTQLFSGFNNAGGTGRFAVNGGYVGTVSNHPFILFQNNSDVARLDATGFNPFTTASFDLGTPSLLWRDMYIRGIVGVITNSNAQTGSVGEYVSSLVAIGSPVSLSNGIAANATSISLTAGDWDVDGQVSFTETTSTVTARSAGISSTTATVPSDGSEAYCGVQSTVTSEINSISLVKKRFSLSGTTTIYLVGKASFSAGSCGIFGVISARRVR